MNIVTASARTARADSTVAALATGGVHKWKFPEGLEGTGLVALSIRLAGSWHHSLQTARYPRLIVVAQADPSRDGSDQIVEDAEDRAVAILNALDHVFHRPTREAVLWGGPGGVLVLGSERETDPSPVNRVNVKSQWFQSIYDLKVAT